MGRVDSVLFQRELKKGEISAKKIVLNMDPEFYSLRDYSGKNR